MVSPNSGIANQEDGKATLIDCTVADNSDGVDNFPDATLTLLDSVLAGNTPCLATGCGNASKSKGLCAAHYQKALRLKIKGPNLTQAEKDTLGQDGRALRFKKAKK